MGPASAPHQRRTESNVGELLQDGFVPSSCHREVPAVVSVKRRGGGGSDSGGGWGPWGGDDSRWDDDGVGAATGKRQRRRRRRRQTRMEENKTCFEAWDRVAPMLRRQYLRWVGSRALDQGEGTRPEALLSGKILSRLAEAPPPDTPCPVCGGDCCYAVVEGMQHVLVVDFDATISLPHPSRRCSKCMWNAVAGAAPDAAAPPLLFGTFPATPVSPSVLYTVELLDAVGALMASCRTGAGGLARGLHALQTRQQSTRAPSHDSAWRHLHVAAEQWRRLKSDISTDEFKVPSPAAATSVPLDVAEPAAAKGPPLRLRLGGGDCAACWRAIRAAMADGCMGLTRLKSAGRAQAFRLPQRSGLFLDRVTVQDALQCEGKAGADAAAAAVDCSDHAAAKGAASAAGKRHTYYDRMGIAVFCCRHEQVCSPQGDRLPQTALLLLQPLDARILSVSSALNPPLTSVCAPSSPL